MLACAVGAALIAARVFALPVLVSVLATLAWAPVTGAVVIGQNTPFALLLAMVAVAAIVEGRQVTAGAAAIVLLYKPTIGLPLAGLFVLRARWRAVAWVGVGVIAWYLIGIWAAGGSWSWPSTWLSTIGRWLTDDAVRNADKAVSLPGLLSRLGLSDLAMYGAGALLVLAALPRLARAPLREAAAGALLVGVAASPHAWSYEAALLMPIIWWTLAGGIAEPWRTRSVVAAYVIAPLWMVSRQTIVSAVAIVVLGALVIWLSGMWRGDPSSVAGIDVGGQPA